MTGLLDLPVELLDQVIHWLMVGKDAYRRPERLYPFLLSNKALFFLAVKHLYQVVSFSSFHNARTGLKTLASSLRGTAYVTYHQNIEEFIFDGEVLEDNSKDDALQELLDSVLLSGNLRKLDIDRGDSLQLGMESNLTRLTNLSITGLLSTSLLNWLLIMLPQMQLENLDISLADAALNWDPFSLRENTLKSLKATGRSELFRDPNLQSRTSFSRTFLATQWHSLTSLQCTYICLTMDQTLNLPNLHTLELICCCLEGWEHLWKSVTMLKRLEFRHIRFRGMQPRDYLSTLPMHMRLSLESLLVYFDHAISDRNAHWFSAYASSFASLREFGTNQVSFQTMNALLTHCSYLETLVHIGDFASETLLTEANLKILSDRAPLNLKSVTLHDGKFCLESWAILFKSFPALQYLVICHLRGLTPSILRAMFQLPLRKLELKMMKASNEHYEELNQISKMEKPLGLKFSYDC